MIIKHTEDYYGWTQIENALLYDPTLTDGEKLLLIKMLSLPHDWQFSVKGLAAYFKISRTTVSKHVNSLEANGYIYKMEQSHDDGGRFIKADWIVSDRPVSDWSAIIASITGAHFTVTGDTVTGKTVTGKLCTTKKEKTKTERIKTDGTNLANAFTVDDIHFAN